MISHCFTVDVEEYFQVSAFERRIPRAEWSRWPRRLDRVMPTLLDLLERHDVKGTFFVLGWVADQTPEIVRSIADRGHEIASHGYWHRRVHTLDARTFAEELRTSKASLEQLTGREVTGFRAPSFSVIPGVEWAFDVLLDAGYRYDSSIFPIRRRGYGYPGAPGAPHLIRRPGGVLAEFPLATARVANIRLPAAGGGYLRQLPYALTQRAFAQATARRVPATFYVHPWEIDPDQPRVPASLLTRLRHYRGLDHTLPRMNQLLTEFRFGPVASHLSALVAQDSPAHGER